MFKAVFIVTAPNSRHPKVHQQVNGQTNYGGSIRKLLSNKKEATIDICNITRRNHTDNTLSEKSQTQDMLPDSLNFSDR